MERREVRRKIVHMLLGIIFVFLVYFNLFEGIHFILLFFIGLILSFLCRHYYVPFFSPMLALFERSEEMSSFPGKGAITFVAGCGLAVLLFSKTAALTAIIVLSIADAASLIVGKFFGRIGHPFNPHKHLEGLIAGFVFGVPAALIFLPTMRAFIVAAFAALIETMHIHFGHLRIDDNLSVPLATGLITSLLMLVP